MMSREPSLGISAISVHVNSHTSSWVERTVAVAVAHVGRITGRHDDTPIVEDGHVVHRRIARVRDGEGVGQPRAGEGNRLVDRLVQCDSRQDHPDGLPPLWRTDR